MLNFGPWHSRRRPRLVVGVKPARALLRSLQARERLGPAKAAAPEEERSRSIWPASKRRMKCRWLSKASLGLPADHRGMVVSLGLSAHAKDGTAAPLLHSSTFSDK